MAQKTYLRVGILYAGAMLTATVAAGTDTAKLEVCLQKVVTSAGFPGTKPHDVPNYALTMLRTLAFECVGTEWQYAPGRTAIAVVE